MKRRTAIEIEGDEIRDMQGFNDWLLRTRIEFPGETCVVAAYGRSGWDPWPKDCTTHFDCAVKI